MALQPDEAWRRIEERLQPLPEETVGRRADLGRVLARSMAATVDVPAGDVSAMDGYALTGDAGPGESRPVVLVVAAGAPPGFELSPPGVARIITGAPVPGNADRVVPVEETDAGRETVIFLRPSLPGQHIRRRGEILRSGAPLLSAGSRLTPGALSLLAAHGHAEVPVHRAPRVAVITTGDEVVPPETAPAPGQLRDSHTDFLLAAGAPPCGACWGSPTPGGEGRWPAPWPLRSRAPAPATVSSRRLRRPGTASSSSPPSPPGAPTTSPPSARATRW